MRQIKFRAWDNKLKQYHPAMGFGDKTFTIFVKRVNFSSRYIIEQFTGLQDKNGKDIYEGDIIEEGGKNGTIVWNNEYARFEIEMNNGRAGMYLVHGTVIGNIHESKN